MAEDPSFRLIILPDVEQDIREIEEYLTKEAGFGVAAEVVNNVFRTIETTLQQPLSGRVVDKEFVVRRKPCLRNAANWLIYWEVHGDLVVVLRVIRGERQTQRSKVGDKG